MTTRASEPSDAAPPPDDAANAAPRRPWLRAGLLVLLLGGLVIAGFASGITEHLTVDNIRDYMADAGATGVVVFLALFAAGQLVQVPGMIFVSAGALAYGEVIGFFLGWAGCMISIMLSFVIVRFVGGRLLNAVENKWIKRALAHLDKRPFTTVLVLRTAFSSSPILNYALSMTNVRVGPYFLGAALGIVPAIVITVFVVDSVVS